MRYEAGAIFDRRWRSKRYGVVQFDSAIACLDKVAFRLVYVGCQPERLIDQFG